jgi:hypothetical protein
VRKNKGSPGSDGMTVDELPTHLRQHWPRCVGNWPETLPIGSAIEPVDPAAPVPEAPEPAATRRPRAARRIAAPARITRACRAGERQRHRPEERSSPHARNPTRKQSANPRARHATAPHRDARQRTPPAPLSDRRRGGLPVA